MDVRLEWTYHSNGRTTLGRTTRVDVDVRLEWTYDSWSWTYDSSGIDLQLDGDDNAGDTSNFISNGEWQLIGQNVLRYWQRLF